MSYRYRILQILKELYSQNGPDAYGVLDPIDVLGTSGTMEYFTAINQLLAEKLILGITLKDSDKIVFRLNPEKLGKVENELQLHEATNVVVILFLAADPTNASRLRLGEEFREIQEKLKLAQLRDHFKLALPQLSIRPADISQALLDVQPQIVHFSGHGASTGALCFENQLGQTHLVQPDALAALFEQFAHQVNCVLLNACYSEIQAKAIAEHIKYVIGMNQAIGDQAAIAFAIGFYQALGAGRAIEDAYKLGCAQIRLQGISEHLTPILITKQQAKSVEAAEPVPSLAVAEPDSTSAIVAPNVSVEFSYEALVRSQDLHEYFLAIKVKNNGARAIASFKLQFTFPNIGMFISHRTYSPSRRHIMFSEDRSGNFLVIYQSIAPLFPKDEIDLTREVAWKYKVDDTIYTKIRGLYTDFDLSLDWTFYADSMPPLTGSVPLSKLHVY